MNEDETGAKVASCGGEKRTDRVEGVLETASVARRTRSIASSLTMLALQRGTARARLEPSEQIRLRQ